MKHIPFIAICALAFLPTPAEGQLILIFIFALIGIQNAISNIFFPAERNERDCDSLIAATGLTNNEQCFCVPQKADVLNMECYSNPESICLVPTNELYCTSGSSYRAYSTTRKRLAIISPAIRIAQESVDVFFGGDTPNYYYFNFYRDTNKRSSVTYSECSVQLTSLYCLCEICDGGADFKYDCSNVFRDGFPGPKVDSCFPVADLVPSI